MSAHHDDELCCPDCQRPYGLHGINCASLSHPEIDFPSPGEGVPQLVIASDRALGGEQPGGGDLLETIRWNIRYRPIPLGEWLLGWLKRGDAEFWSPLQWTWDGWVWGYDAQPLPDDVRVLAWAKGPRGPKLQERVS
jgi:hypothetical protein